MRLIFLRCLLQRLEPARVQNMNTPLPDIECHIIESEKPATATVIWLHGLGASAHDFDAIIPYLRTNPTFAQVRFIFPQAPMRAVTLNNGFVMPAWYDIYQLDKHGPQDEEGIKASSLQIQKIIDQQIQTGIPAEKIFLVGFSQGGAIALYASLYMPKTLAGIIGLSTYLPMHTKLDASAINASNSYWLAHGTHDNVVALNYGEESVEKLRELGCQVGWHTYPIAHEISLPEMEAMSTWMVSRLQQ